MIYLHRKFIDFFHMNSNMYRGFILIFLFNCLALIPLNVDGQEMLKPLKNTILLSGNFGELRATHFHSGIDIRTGGVEGLPVICVKDGQLARVSVSPVGYGHALYIEHNDGTTTVYGHLQRFVPRIADIVRRIQYQKEQFRIDEDFKPFQVVFRQGDTIAYSGNTGSSGGPHLHFEVRNTRTEHAFNPLRYYSIRDTKAPVVKMVYLYQVAENGYVELIRRCPAKNLGDGKYSAGRVTVPAGKIGVGVFVIDYMNDSWNKLGIYRMSLVAGTDTLFSLGVDSCSFGQNCFINEIKDFDCYKKKETVYRCFGNYQDRFLGVHNVNRGCIEVGRDSVRKVKIDLEDINGNRSSVTLELKGKTETAPLPEDSIWRYDRKHLLELEACRVEIQEGALFSSVKRHLAVENDTLTGRKIFILSEKDVPLFKKAHLTIRGKFGQQAIICEVGAAGKLYPVETVRTDTGVSAEIGYLNRYTVVDDREAPDIAYLGKFPDQTLRFKIKDELSGIARYRGEVNGQWCLFSYDPRVDVIRCRLAEPVFQPGKANEVKIYVEDKAGNRNELKISVKK